MPVNFSPHTKGENEMLDVRLVTNMRNWFPVVQDMYKDACLSGEEVRECVVNNIYYHVSIWAGSFSCPDSLLAGVTLRRHFQLDLLIYLSPYGKRLPIPSLLVIVTLGLETGATLFFTLAILLINWFACLWRCLTIRFQPFWQEVSRRYVFNDVKKWRFVVSSWVEKCYSTKWSVVISEYFIAFSAKADSTIPRWTPPLCGPALHGP